MKKQLEVGMIDKRKDGYHLIAWVDHVTGETGTIQFGYYGDALKFKHDRSLEQFPEWHKQHCPECR